MRRERPDDAMRGFDQISMSSRHERRHCRRSGAVEARCLDVDRIGCDTFDVDAVHAVTVRASGTPSHENLANGFAAAMKQSTWRCFHRTVNIRWKTTPEALRAAELQRLRREQRCRRTP